MPDPAPILVFAHYFGGSARSWDPLVAALGGGFVCCTPDLDGFGGSPAPAAPDLAHYAGQIERLSGGRPWVAVGHSMGGKAALSASASRPEGLVGLVLIAPSPPTPEPMTEHGRRDMEQDFGDRDAARRHIDQIAPGTLPATIRAQAIEDEVGVDRAVWTWWLERGSREDISARTQGLDLPTLVLTGDQDKVMGLHTPFGVAGSLANAEVQVLAGGGHLVPLEQPDEVAARMRAFLQGLG